MAEVVGDFDAMFFERTVHLRKIKGENNIAVQYVSLNHRVNEEGKKTCDVTKLKAKIYDMGDSNFIKDTVLWLRSAQLPEQ